MDRDLIKAYRFFKEHAGYVVGRAAECALSLAKAEQQADGRVIFDWTGDDIGCECEGDKHNETLCCLARDVETGKTASLCGICDPGAAYSRVVEAELASEIFAEIEASERNDAQACAYMAL